MTLRPRAWLGGIRLRTYTFAVFCAAFALLLTFFYFLTYYLVTTSFSQRAHQETRTQVTRILRSFRQHPSTPFLDSLLELQGGTAESRLALYVEDTLTGVRWGPSGAQILRRTLIDSTHPTDAIIFDVRNSSLRARVAMDETVIDEVGEEIKSAFGWLLLLGTLAASITALIASRITTRPLSVLTEHVETMGPDNTPLPTQAISEIETLRMALERLLNERSMRIQSLKNFTADVAHELRTPLTIMKGEIEVEMRSVSDPTTRESLAHTLEQTDRLIGIVQDMLYLARMEEPIGDEITDQSLDAIVTSLLHQRQAAVTAKNLSIEKRIPQALCVRGSRAPLERLISNLLDNAIRYSPTSSVIRLESEESSKHVTLSISDNGPGIPAEFLQHAFDRFRRFDSARDRKTGGSGLGLAIARAIADRYGYTLELTSTPGAGTVASIRFTV